MLGALEASSDDVRLDPGVLIELKSKIQGLTIKQNLKNEILRRVTLLEQKQGLIRQLENMEKNITKKVANGKIEDTEAQALIDLLTQIEAVL